VFASLNGVPFRALPIAPEAGSVDNALNLMSMVSLPGWHSPTWVLGALEQLATVTRVVMSPKYLMQMPGGNNVTGTLGHVGAVLELCEQLAAGNSAAEAAVDGGAGAPAAAAGTGQCALPRQPEHIFLALGSNCTVSGLLAGIALARKLGLGFAAPVTVHGVPIHHDAERWPSMLRWAVRKVATDTLRTIAELGGPDARPQLHALLQGNGKGTGKRTGAGRGKGKSGGGGEGEGEEASEGLQLHCGYGVAYGGWTGPALAAKLVLDGGSVRRGGQDVGKPWLCSTFTSKAFAALMDFLRENPHVDPACTMAWCTKSTAQPLGDAKGWENIAQLPRGAREWLKTAHLASQSDYERLEARCCTLSLKGI
jgi:hypothetical protein